MPKRQHSEEQIIAALKQYEAGDKTADICRKLGVSQATFYMWQAFIPNATDSALLAGKTNLTVCFSGKSAVPCWTLRAMPDYRMSR